MLICEGRDVVVTRGSTYENPVNLASGFFDQVIRKYEGTRLGRQELLAEVLEDTPGALWNREALGRSLSHLIEVYNGLAPRGVQFRSLSESIDTTTPTGKLTLSHMAHRPSSSPP